MLKLYNKLLQFKTLLSKMTFFNFFSLGSLKLKKVLYFSIGNGQPSEQVLCQLYRHTFVPYSPAAGVQIVLLIDQSEYEASK